MISKSKWLVVLLVSALTVSAHINAPFDLVENYVKEFQLRVEEMSRRSEEYRFVQEEYDGLAHEDAKLLIGKFQFVFSGKLIYFSVMCTSYASLCRLIKFYQSE